MDRRSFIKFSAAGVLLPAVGKFSPAEGMNRRKDRYNVVILGDTHYDAKDPETYHAGYTDPDPKREALHRSEFVRNGNMWAERCPRMVKRASCLVDDETKFIYQAGDLIQGDTADAETHKRFLEDTMDLFKKSMETDLPFITVAGNHDLRGNDDKVATQAYRDCMIDRMSRELGKEITDTNFSFRVGEDAFVALNYASKDVPTVEKMLKESEGARHVFVLVHTPVFPFDGKYWYWFLMGNKKDSRSEERRYIRSLLARNNAIVLCGHTHMTELTDWKGDGGRITQMTFSSVWAHENQALYKDLASGPKDYGELIQNEKPELKGGVATKLFDEYRSGLQRYSTSDSAGSYKMTVDGGDVFVDFYGGDSTRLTKRFILR